MKLKNKTFSSKEPSKGIISLFTACSVFYEAFFEFITLFLLLYVQLASPLIESQSSQYRRMLLVITLGLVFVKILVGFGYTVMGNVIDRRDYPLGRYRTFILFGSLTTSFFFLLLFFVTPLFSGWVYVILFLIFYFFTYLAYSANDVAFFSYLNTFSSDEKKKSLYSSLANGAGVIGAYLTASLSPSITAGDAKRNMTIFAAVLLVLYLSSQLLLAFFMREREESVRFHDQKKESLLSPLKLFFSDRQVLLTMSVFLLIFIAQDLVIGNGTNYFYYEYGYGNFAASGIEGGLSGGRVSFFFTLFFGIGNSLSGLLYPLISKKLSKKDILIFFGILISVIYALLFFFGYRRGYEYFLFFLSFALSFVHGIIYTPFFVNCFELREYYLAKTGEDKNASIQGLRCSLPSIANAVQVAFFYLFLSSSGLVPANERISSFEACLGSDGVCPTLTDVNFYLQNQVSQTSKNVYLSSMTFLPLLITLAAIVLTLGFVKVNSEKVYSGYVRTIVEREAEKASQM